MPDEKKPEAKEAPAKVQPSSALGPNPSFAEEDKKAASDEKNPTSLPKRGRAIRITALGTNKRVYKGKVFTNQGTILTPEGEGFNHGLVEELRKDPVVAAGFAIENFEDGELVIPKR